MKAFVVHAPGQSTIEEVESPVAKPGHVVIDIARAGVCGTDVEFFNGDMAYFQTGEAKYPMRLGHEWCGTVSSAGEGVDKNWPQNKGWDGNTNYRQESCNIVDPRIVVQGSNNP